MKTFVTDTDKQKSGTGNKSKIPAQTIYNGR